MNRENASSLIEVLNYRADVQCKEPCYTFLNHGEHEGERLNYGELGQRLK